MSQSQDCQAEACEIQSCIQRNNYDESKCQSQIFALYKCCLNMYQTTEKEGTKPPESSACPLKEIVERRMKRFEK
ncbi:hypothetical protein J008_06491 [Cryptococcus neoformans]|nr:hypothetical protein C362_06468 [Cryptococcus neoformans var. grubii Bt1]OXH22207.1 hypothetical protein J008_06491 [Cryptococcus neoformans var. grubii]